MARGKTINKEIERIIAKVYETNPSMPAHAIRARANEEYRGIYPDTPWEWPGLSAVQKTLQKIRLNEIQTTIDTPWSLYTLAEYDIDADALQSVLDAYAMTVSWDIRLLTIREALWVARLYCIITDTEELTIAARECAENEKINAMTADPLPCLVDGDFKTRAITGKPGIRYSYSDKGGFQFEILDRRINDEIDFVQLPKRVTGGYKKKKKI